MHACDRTIIDCVQVHISQLRKNVLMSVFTNCVSPQEVSVDSEAWTVVVDYVKSKGGSV